MRTQEPVTLRVRPGPYFWFSHLWNGTFWLCLSQALVLTATSSGLFQAIVAGTVAAVFLFTGIRTELRVDRAGVTIRNPFYTRRIEAADLSLVTRQRVGLAAPRFLSDCLALWARGSKEGWPVIATLRYSRGRIIDRDLWQLVGHAVGTPVDEVVVNGTWRPGSFSRRSTFHDEVRMNEERVGFEEDGPGSGTELLVGPHHSILSILLSILQGVLLRGAAGRFSCRIHQQQSTL